MGENVRNFACAEMIKNQTVYFKIFHPKNHFYDCEQVILMFLLLSPARSNQLGHDFCLFPPRPKKKLRKAGVNIMKIGLQTMIM